MYSLKTKLASLWWLFRLRGGLRFFSTLTVSYLCARVTSVRFLRTSWWLSRLRELNCDWNPICLRWTRVTLSRHLLAAHERERFWQELAWHQEQRVRAMSPLKVELDKLNFGQPTEPAYPVHIITSVDMRLLRFCNGDAEKLKQLRFLSSMLADDVFHSLVNYQANSQPHHIP
jgi:hypothetical protein